MPFPFSGKAPSRLDFSLGTNTQFGKRSVSATIPSSSTTKDFSNMLSLSSSQDDIAPFVCPKPGSSVLKKLASSKKYFNKAAVDNNSNINDSPPTVESLQLDRKLNQIAEFEARLISLKCDFNNDITSWQSRLPDDDCKAIVERLKQLVHFEVKTSRMMNEKLSKAALAVEGIKHRENKQTRLGCKRYEIEQKKKSVDLLHGLNSTDANTLDDELEENFFNFKVVQRQFSRAIKNDLKEKVNDLIITANGAVKTLGVTLDELVHAMDDEDNEPEENSDLIGDPSNYEENKRDENDVNNDYKQSARQSGYSKVRNERTDLNVGHNNPKNPYYGGNKADDKGYKVLDSADAWGN